MLILCLLVVFLVHAVTPECPERCMCSRFRHYVNCAQASLKEVPRLSVSTKTVVVNLSENNITTLANRVFQDHNFVNMSVLDLYANNITFIDSGAFSGYNENLLSLNLGGNFHLQLPENGFELESLHSLDMSFCNLKSIPPNFFRGMPFIDTLRLHMNKLTHFDPSIIAPGQGLELLHLYLSYNNFTRLDLKLVKYQTSDMIIYGNPFHCDCEFLLAYSIYSKHEIYNRQSVTCHSPAYLKGKSGDQLLKMNLDCVGEELTVSLKGRSWWYTNQWWILTLCALAVVLVATLVHNLHTNNESNVVQWLWSSFKFTFQD